MLKAKQNLINILLCVADLVIGILLFINPVKFTTGVLIVLGAALAVLGVFNFVQHFIKKPQEAAQGDTLTKGLLLLLVGIFLIFRSDWIIASFTVLTAFYGVLLLIFGIGKIQRAIDMVRLQLRYWYVAAISAVLTLVLSVLILANPFGAVDILWTFIAVSLIIEAIIDLAGIIANMISSKKSGDDDKNNTIDVE